MAVNTNFQVPFIPQEGITSQILSALQLANEQHQQQQRLQLAQQSQQSQAQLQAAQAQEATARQSQIQALTPGLVALQGAHSDALAAETKLNTTRNQIEQEDQPLKKLKLQNDLDLQQNELQFAKLKRDLIASSNPLDGNIDAIAPVTKYPAQNASTKAAVNGRLRVGDVDGALKELDKTRDFVTQQESPKAQAELAELRARTGLIGAQTELTRANISQGPTTDALGGTVTAPAGGIKEANKRADSFKKDADNLARTEGTFNQFQDVLKDINAGKDITGAQSVVSLFNAIGISAEPLQGKGFRINNNTIQEHAEARGLGESLYQKFLGLKNGDIITPNQIKDYAEIASRSRHDAYVNKINEARGMGVNPDFLLPRGNGRAIDSNTAQIFYDAASGATPQEKAANASRAARATGWNF